MRLLRVLLLGPLAGCASAGGPAEAGESEDPLAQRGPLETVARAPGFGFLEGPQWFEGELLFSDIPNGRIHALGQDGTVRVFREPSLHANGLEVDPGGRLVAAQHGARQVERRDRSGTWTAVVTRFEGRRLNSPNDLVARSDGTLYFTDPEWGIVPHPELHELDFNGLFRVDPAGRLTAEWKTPWLGHGKTPRPNGVALSPAEDTLYLSDDGGDRILVFAVAAGGGLTPRGEWGSCPGPDGMAVDDGGNVYVGCRDGVTVYRPDGSPWGRIPTPGKISNVAFGGADRRDLFMTAGQAVLRVRLAVQGRL